MSPKAPVTVADGWRTMSSQEIAAKAQLARMILTDTRMSLSNRLIFGYGKLAFIPDEAYVGSLRFQLRGVQEALYGGPIDGATGKDMERTLEEMTEKRKREVIAQLRLLIRDLRTAHKRR